jgi:phosphoglycolate phosphatase
MSFVSCKSVLHGKEKNSSYYISFQDPFIRAKGRKMNFKAVIFDLDGTLLNTLEDLAEATNIVLRHLGYREHDLQAYKYFVGNGIEPLVKQALPESERNEESLHRCVELMKSEYARRWTHKSRPYPGISDLLEGFISSGYQLNILSNKADEATRQIVAELLPRWRFNTVLGATAATPKKPDPTAALNIAEQCGITPRETLFLGDTSIDMQTARACGMYGIGVLWGFRPAEELIAGGAQMLIKEPQDLLPWI